MPQPTKKKDKNILTSLNHALKVLDLLSVRDQLGVSEISRITGYDKSSVYKMLYTLEHRGYVIKTPEARYGLSGKLSGHGDQASSRQNTTDVAIPYMWRLRNDCDETVYLGVLNTNGRVIFIHKEDGRAPDSVVTRTAYEIDAYTNATGKVLLANLDMVMQESLVSAMHLQPHTERTITSAQKLMEELARLRGASWAEQYDENYVGHSDLASPIYDADGRCIAALSITCATTTLREKKEYFLPLLLQSSENISRKMGWRRSP